MPTGHGAGKRHPLAAWPALVPQGNIQEKQKSRTTARKIFAFFGSSGIFWALFIGQNHTLPHPGAPLNHGRRLTESPGRAYSRGLGESVTRGDRRRRELEFGSPSPPLASPRE
jgi:hypothetical protein